MTDHDQRAESAAMEAEERRVRELMERAGPRPEIPAEDLERITAAARESWREAVRDRGKETAARSTKWTWAMSLAAVLAVAVGVAAWWSSRPAGGPAPEIAHLERVTGSVLLDTVGAVGEGVEVGDAIPAGAVLRVEGGEAGSPGRAALRFLPEDGAAGGAVLRLDAGTRLRLVSARIFELERGALYADTDPIAPAAPAPSGSGALEVRTPLGTARDLGTRFALRLLEVPERALEVRVRDGAVSVERAGATHVAAAGEELTLHRDGETLRRKIAVHGPEWDWVLAAAPRFTVEGKSLRQLLDWVARETGWTYRFEDEELAASADEITLHGSLGGLRPDQAPFAVLPSAGLEGQLDDGTLIVRRGP